MTDKEVGELWTLYHDHKFATPGTQDVLFDNIIALIDKLVEERALFIHFENTGNIGFDAGDIDTARREFGLPEK